MIIKRAPYRKSPKNEKFQTMITQLFPQINIKMFVKKVAKSTRIITGAESLVF